MRTRRTTACVAMLLLAACGRDEPGAPGTAPLAIGAVFHGSVSLADARDGTHKQRLDRSFGRKATVLMGWSVSCPCVDAVEHRVEALMKQFSEERGVRWIALDGEPADTAEQAVEKLLRLGSPYTLLLDPEQRACVPLRLPAATVVAVLDADHRLRYVGPMDEDFADGTGEYLAAVLAAVLAGDPPPYTEHTRVYGCEFADPGSCFTTR